MSSSSQSEETKDLELELWSQLIRGYANDIRHSLRSEKSSLAYAGKAKPKGAHEKNFTYGRQISARFMQF